MKKAITYILMVIVSFVAIYYTIEMSRVISRRISEARWRANAAERQRKNDERNLYLMAQLPEYFAGSYYRHDRSPSQLVILMVEGGYLAAGELGLFGDAYIRECTICFHSRNRQPIEFTYAQLLETKAAVIAAMEARPRCVYVSSVGDPRIWVAYNRVVLETRNLTNLDFEDVFAGFRQHVYDSEMIEFMLVFELCLGGGQGTFKPAAAVLAVIVATVMFFAVEIYKDKREQNRADKDNGTALF